MKTFRCSFSILEPWSKGDWDEAIRRFYKTSIKVTPQMQAGRLMHEQWRAETNQTSCLPAVFGGKPLDPFKCEEKMECTLDGWLNFVGIVDCMENHTIHEYKTGAADSLTYSRTMQTKVYQLLCAENAYYPNQAVIRHYNQYTQRVTTSYQYLSAKTLEYGREWIITNASEMANAMEEAGQL